jgi:GT2 family glycosyltransferase
LSSNRPDLSIIIVSYNVRDLLRECLRSVADSAARSGLTVETWVIDNASTDGSADLVAAEFPAVRLIARRDNPGFAAANNDALRQATGRHLLLLNPDTVVRGDTLGETVRFLDANPRAGGVGAKLLNPDGSRQMSCFRFPTLAMAFLDFFPINHRLTNSRLNGRYSTRDDARVDPVVHPLGAYFAVRREAFEMVGYLDERFFMYCEEVDWARRIWKAGYPIWYLPTTEVVHYGGQSAKQARSKMYVELYRSRFRLFAKHEGPIYNLLVRGIVRLGLASEARKARAAAARGELTRLELEETLEAYRQVAKL